ncbi:MAG: DUF255 domain-containing protein [Cocleimonas sp.]
MKLLFTVWVLFFTLSINANPLKNHSSPYLALHGDDPVNWMEWGKPALDKAKKENKLLFVSIGYFACHWCHVMQRESYADKGIAQQLNKNYISIKVDRELNPVLDKRLIEFVQVTNGTAGWPLNVFITPDGFPLVGATYMPREHFSSVLKQLDKKWATEEKSLTAQAKDMSKTLVTMLQGQEASSKTSTLKALSESYIEVAMKYADTMQGGFGQQRKFPQIPQLWAMVKQNKKTKNKEADEFINLTLKQMMTQGLHDELAGGFYRYTTDPDWETPHFEKMVYTNAMMPLLYFDAADQYNNASYRKIALETLSYLKNEMRGQSNAFIASLSAVDDKGEEGGYYLWKQQELKTVLNAQELKTANHYWNLARANELPAGNLPRQALSIVELAKKLNVSPLQAAQSITNIKKKLKAHRNKTRVIPRDTKLLAGMNGLTLAAFSRGLKYDKSLQPTGEKLAQFLINLWNGKTLRRSAANAKTGTLYDYAAVSWGLLKWGEASNNAKAKQVGTAIAKAAWSRFYKDDSWVENPDSLLPQGVKQAHIADSSLISSEALLLEASMLSQDSRLIASAKTVLNNITRFLETDVYAFASLLSVLK